MEFYKINWTEPAISDLENILRYILQTFGAQITAANIEKKITNSVAKLSTWPQKHPHIGIKNYRRKLVKNTNYVIVYSVDEIENRVFIERIFHSKQNWMNY